MPTGRRSSGPLQEIYTLAELEMFKRKFLLANKHIAKLNSTLRVRVEGLNAQVSALCAENLRLRGTNIALASELRREQDKTRRIMADAELAAMSLVNQLGVIRGANHIPARNTPPHPSSQPSIKVYQKPTIPPAPRVSCAPDFSQIDEGSDADNFAQSLRDEFTHSLKFLSPRPFSPTLSEPDEEDSPTLEHTSQQMPSRLPVRSLSPPVRDAAINGDVNRRRVSGTVVPPRVASSGFGSPIRIAEDEEEQLAEKTEPGTSRLKDRRREKFIEKQHATAQEEAGSEAEPHLSADTQIPSVRSVKPKSSRSTSSRRRNTQGMPEENLQYNGVDRIPRSRSTGPYTPLNKSKPAVIPRSHSAGSISEPEQPLRERRSRKSVNYTEPKLNTKVRKPRPEDTIASTHLPTPLSVVKASSAKPNMTRVRRQKSTHGSTMAEDDEEDDDEGAQVMASTAGRMLSGK